MKYLYQPVCITLAAVGVVLAWCSFFIGAGTNAQGTAATILVSLILLGTALVLVAGIGATWCYYLTESRDKR